MNKKLDPKANNHGRLLLVFLVLLMSVLVMLPSGCLDSDQDKQEDPGAQSVTPDKDPTVPPKPTDDDNDDIPVKVTDDDKPEDVSTSQAIKRSFSSGGSSRSSSSPAPSSPDVSRTIDSGDYTESLRTITGDLTITGATDGTITLPANLTVNGDLIVDTPNATVTNRANIGGTITINAVSVNTWNQYGNARSIQMGAENATLNFFAGDVPQGIKLTKPSRLVINASSGLPNVTVTGDAQDSDIDNLGGGELNLTAEANVTVAGNVNVTGNVTVTERTARGSLTLNPTSAVYNTNVDMIVTYTAGENLTTGVVNITVPTGFNVTSSTLKINDIIEDPSYIGKVLNIEGVNIAKDQTIELTLAPQTINETGNYDFTATASNDTKLTSNAATARFTSTLNNDADLSALTVGTGTLDPTFDKATTAYDVDVAYDVESIDVTATLSDKNASMLVNGTEATSNVAEPVSLNASGQSTSIDVVVTAEDGETTETYTVTVIRAAGPEPVVLGDPTPIAFAASNPMTTLSISGTNFTAEANDTANWVIDTGITSLDTPVITLQDEGGMATSLTINFNGTAAEGTITFKALNATLVADQDSNEVSLTISDTTPDYAWDVHVTDIHNPITPINARFNLYSDSEFENPASLTESLAKDSTTVYASMINQLGTTYYTVFLNRTVDNSGWDVIVETDNINNYFAAYIVTTFNDTTVSLYSDADLESSTSLEYILTNETGYIKVTAKDDFVTSYKVTITRAAASTDATVSSVDYAIDSPAGTIAGVPDSTNVTVFKDKLTHRTGASLEVYESDGKTERSGNVVTGDVVIVTAEDTTTTKTYTVTVVSPLSTDATVSSGDYAIDSPAGTIAGVPDGTDVTVFKGNLTHRTGASLEVYESDGKTERSGNVVTGDVVIVTAEDATTTKTYTVTVK